MEKSKFNESGEYKVESEIAVKIWKMIGDELILASYVIKDRSDLCNSAE